MKKKNHLKNLFTIIGLISLITASTITYAEHTVGDYELVCKESIQYYNPSKPNLEEGDELTVIDCPTNADGESTDHGDFPGDFPSEYTGDFDITVEESDKTKHESITRHTHSYTNTSEEECFNAADIKIACPEDGSNHTGFNTIKYKATWIKKVELTLHEDLMENVDTNELDCEITNSDTTDETTCTGEGTLGFNNNEPPQEMGYDITFTDHGTTGTILLEFAENDAEGWVMPVLFGNNPHLDHLNGFDLSDPNERTYDFGLSFETEEAEELFWSATTTSRIYLTDAIATMDPGVEPETADWFAGAVETGDSHESPYYYWFDIGTATTIWEKDPEEEVVCSELSVNDPSPIYEDFETATFSANATGSDGEDYGTKISYSVAGDGGTGTEYGYFYEDDPSGEGENPPSNAISANHNVAVYFLAEKPGEAVIEVKPTGYDSETCLATFNVEPLCDDLEVNYEDPIYEGNLTYFQAAGSTHADDNFSGKISYNVDSGHGLFYTSEPTEADGYDYTDNADLEGVSPVEELDMVSFDISYYDDYCEDSEVAAAARDRSYALKGAIPSTLEAVYFNDLGDFKYKDAVNPVEEDKVTLDYSMIGILDKHKYITIPAWIEENVDPTPVMIKTELMKFNPKLLKNSVIAAQPDNPAWYDGAMEAMPIDDLIDIGSSPGPESDGPESDGPESDGPESDGPESDGAESDGAESDGAESDGAESEGAESDATDNICETDEQNGLESILVCPGQKVWFYAIEKGEQVIHVEANCANSDTCIRHFDIIGLPVCEEFTLTQASFEANEEGEINISNLVDTNGNDLPDDTEITVTITATDGILSKDEAEVEVITNGDIIVPSDFPIYYSGGEDGDISFEITDSDYSSDSCTATVDIGVIAVCSTLTVDPSSFDPNTSGEISITVEDTNGDALDTSTEIGINNTTGGTLESGAITDVATISQFPLTFDGGESGDITFTLADAESDYYSTDCTDTILIEEAEVSDCESLELTITEHNGSTKTELTANKVYSVTALTTFSSEASEEDQKVTLTMNSDFGAFILSSDTDQALDDASGLADADLLTKTKLEELGYTDITNSITIRGDDSEIAVLITYDNDDDDDDSDALKAYATNFEDDCSEEVAYKNEEDEEPPEEDPVCTDLDIKEPDSPWSEKYNNDNYELFQIDIDTEPSGNDDEIELVWEIDDDGDANWYTYDEDDEEYNKIDDKIETTGEYIYYLGDINDEEDLKITVYAKDSEQNPEGKCSDSITFTPPEEEEEEEDPEFQKLVYQDEDDADSTLNLGYGNNGENITFWIEFKPGSKTEIVKIKDDSLPTIKGNLDGTLEFVEGSLEISAEDNDDEEIDIEEDDCEDEDSICVEDLDNFEKGKPIKFINANQDILGDDGRITITYEMKIGTEVTTKKCAELDTDDGCGEIFENDAEYEAIFINNDGDEEIEKDGDDSAEVIIICPYILTRAGGDAFFYDLPSTGVDVSYCSEVESGEGVVITPDPEPDPTTPSTGVGEDGGEVYLRVPSHDICTYSNDPNNIVGYNNVLENFSSSICELKADVAEEWQEIFINEAITANIERVARWENNLQGITNHNNKLESPSGVYVKKDGPYKIGDKNDDSDTTIIGKTSETPAAQTYIIQGHDLIIQGNIKYGNTDFSTPSSIPSVAFIVIDGNIIIDPSVTTLHGVYMAVDTNNDGDGQIISGIISDDEQVIGADSNKQLTFYGNLFGNVNDLFLHRTYVGDPMQDGGAVTIHYDERILLNTPPVIGELIDIQQTIVPN